MFSDWSICMAESGPAGLRKAVQHLSAKESFRNIIGTNITVSADLKQN
jgi:hypothetical protein